MQRNRLNLLILFLLFVNSVYFILGFIYQHDFSNGGKIDFDHIYKNFLMFKENSLFSIDWKVYESSSLPLHYIITKYLIPKGNIFFFKFYTFLISICCVFLLYFSLKFKLSLHKINLNVLLISSILLISSSFRTDAFFGLEENIGFFLFLLTFIFLFYENNNNNSKIKFLVIFFSCLTFYSRQTYAFLPIIIFLHFLDKKNILSNFNLKLVFLFLIFLLPSLYFFVTWNSLLPSLASSRITEFNLNKIVVIFGMYIIFTLPFILIQLSTYKNYKINLKKLFFILLIFIIYCFIFWEIPISNFGGGPLHKLYLKFSKFKLVYLLFSFIGVLYVFLLSKKNVYFGIFIIFFTFIYFIADHMFFSYLDPLMLLVILILCKDFDYVISENKIFSLLLFGYFFALHLTWVYYYSVILEGIIR